MGTDHADVIIIGTGMGGATFGYALAEKGLQVLFLEKGASHLAHDAILGDYPEEYFHPNRDRYREILIRAGRYADHIEDISSGRPRRFRPFIGCGTGGSSALYGAALIRFRPEDFAPRQYFANTDGSSLPERWPIGYDDLASYYAAAEAIYRVENGTDARTGGYRPLANPTSEITAQITRSLEATGLHPLRAPTASGSDCSGCMGFRCPSDCKRGSAQVCLMPALERHRAKLLDRCIVLKLEATRDRVTAVHCLHHGANLTLAAPLVVLAAGGLETPRILLNSASDRWPHGLANDSGLVGKNLMRHYIDLYLLHAGSHHTDAEVPKREAFVCDDFYVADGQKFGILHSFSSLPPDYVMLASLAEQFEAVAGKIGMGLFRLTRPIAARAVKRIDADLAIAAIMEDLPMEENCVSVQSSLHPAGQLRIRYHINAADRARIRIFRYKLMQAFKPLRVTLFKQAENNEFLAHVCGTCRFGDDPDTSVLDRHNRAHGLSNLYVVDASFFPSSGGAHPGLTIAANALRVADRIAAGNAHSMDRSKTSTLP